VIAPSLVLSKMRGVAEALDILPGQLPPRKPVSPDVKPPGLLTIFVGPSRRRTCARWEQAALSYRSGPASLNNDLAISSHSSSSEPWAGSLPARLYQ